jgi:hypothetical protein
LGVGGGNDEITLETRFDLFIFLLIGSFPACGVAQTAETGALAGSVLDPTCASVAETNIEILNEVPAKHA